MPVLKIAVQILHLITEVSAEGRIRGLVQILSSKMVPGAWPAHQEPARIPLMNPGLAVKGCARTMRPNVRELIAALHNK